MADVLHYFAYGSNMLAERLQRRCPSAKRIGPAVLSDYGIAFSKIAVDGSGKATIAPKTGGRVEGVLFTLDRTERDLLDGFEGLGKGYDRLDALAVNVLNGGEPVIAMTYMAPAAQCDAQLLPYDWYHALVEAGARQNGLSAGHIAILSSQPFMLDPEDSRPSRVEALDVLKEAGVGRNDLRALRG